jgi:hypothetical protein
MNGGVRKVPSSLSRSLVAVLCWRAPFEREGVQKVGVSPSHPTLLLVSDPYVFVQNPNPKNRATMDRSFSSQVHFLTVRTMRIQS